MSEAPPALQAAVAAAATRLGGTAGVAARNLASGAGVQLNADEAFPLASVFKIPVMVEVMRQADAGALRLDERLTLRESDKSPGSTLIHCQEGLAPTVRDLLYLMITLSDNTATDMLWRRVGVESVNRTMRDLGLATIDCTMPNREYFLFETGLGSEWAGLSGPETVARWREVEGRAAAVKPSSRASSRSTHASPARRSSTTGTSAGGTATNAISTTPSPSTRSSTTPAARATSWSSSA